MKLNDKTYDVLKWIAQIVLPATGTFYFAIASIWGLPYAEQVVGTITAVDTLLGALLGISASTYKKNGLDGVLHIDTSAEDVDKYRFEMTTGFDEIEKKDELRIKVNNGAKG